MGTVKAGHFQIAGRHPITLMAPTFATYFTFSEFNDGVRATPEQFRFELSRFNGPAVVYLCGVMNSVIRDWQGHHAWRLTRSW